MSMISRTNIATPFLFRVMTGALLLSACGSDDVNSPLDDDGASGFTGFPTGGTQGTNATDSLGSDTEGPSSATMGGSSTDSSNPTPGTSAGTVVSDSNSTVSTTDMESQSGPGGPGGEVGSDDGEPEPPTLSEESCDAGDEAFVKRLIPFVHGRRPESIREVRLLTSIIEQLDARGQNGRRVVARGLARGDLYLDRWRTWLYEELRINLAGDRRNDECYNTDVSNAGFGETDELAAFIRDNTAEAAWPGGAFYMTDVVYSGLRLDDISTIYRAELFARMSAPLIAGNVDPVVELDELRRENYGSSFEQIYLGRTTECLQCHRSEWAVTDSPDPAHDRHWPIRGNFELAVYGPTAEEALATRHQAIWRYNNFAYPYYYHVQNGSYPDNTTPAFGMGPECGGFRFTPGPPPAALSGPAYQPYMLADFNVGATIYDMDQVFKQGIDELRDSGLAIGDEDEVSGAQGGAYLFAMNFGNRMWVESMGFPLTVANNFPRNDAQREILQDLAEAFISESYSLRSVISTIATHELFNQAAPAECNTSTLYHLPAVFDPFTKEAADPAATGNGVGDSVHRVGAWPLLDSLARTMWWNKPDTFGEDEFAVAGNLPHEVPEYNCGGDTPQYPCIAEPADAQILRDLGGFLSDSETGFEGIDMVALLRLEREFGQGNDPGMSGNCTGPLGELCPDEDWISQLIGVAMASPEALMWDVATAVKDRIITQTAIAEGAEQRVLENLMGISLDDTVASVGAQDAEAAARRMAGMLFNSPQFMLEGISAPDQDPAADPILVVPGTDTEALCQYLAPLILDNPSDGYTFQYDCSASGIEIAD